MLLGLVNKINKRTLTNMTDMTEMNEYECIIYMMYSEKTHLRYIGATEQTLKVRLTLHRSMFKRWKEGKGRDYGSFRILEIDPEAVLIELERCSKDLKPFREHYWWDTTSDTTNICEPGVFAAAGGRAAYEKEYSKKYHAENKELINAQQAKYRAENRDSIRAQHAKYRAENKELINAQQAKYRAENRDSIRAQYAKYRAENKELINAQQAKYRAENRDSIRAQHAKYRLDNREILNTKARTKITCECGSKLSKRSVARHRRTKKHLAYLSNNNTQ